MSLSISVRSALSDIREQLSADVFLVGVRGPEICAMACSSVLTTNPDWHGSDGN
jgi:hypothetical protein